MTAPPSSRVRVHLWVSGRVQGVGFRFYVQRTALQLGLAGFARNLPDHRLEVAVEGSLTEVEALVDAVRAGPSGAVVSAVEVSWEPASGQAGFTIRTDGHA